MNNCGSVKDLEVTISESSEFDLTISDRDEFTVVLPFLNANNYLQYGENPEDVIELGGEVTKLIYK